MRRLAAVVAISSISICASGQEMRAPGLSDTAPVSAECVEAPQVDVCFQHIVGEAMAQDSALPHDENVRIAVLLLLLQLGIVSTVRDVASFRRR